MATFARLLAGPPSLMQLLGDVLRAIDVSAGPLAGEPQRSEATLFLERVKALPDCHSLALQMLSGGSGTTLHLLFALHLLRSHLGSEHHSPESRLLVRQTLLHRLPDLLALDVAVVNNLANVLTMCIKLDYPELWPEAFDHLLSIAPLSLAGTSLMVRVLAELELEVVVFDERRSAAEIAHNRVVKDEMRRGEPSAVARIVAFLCETAAASRQPMPALSVRCLEALVEFIGWIDIGLVVNDTVLPFLYQCLQEPPLSGVACRCLLEVAKKGGLSELESQTDQCFPRHGHRAEGGPGREDAAHPGPATSAE